MKTRQKYRHNPRRAREKRALPVPELAPPERKCSFSEVVCGYTEEMAVAEAARCHLCEGARAKCVQSCPLGVNIPKFAGYVAARKFQEAYRTIRKENPLPGICGRICPQEALCQAQCAAAADGEAVLIAHLERFVADRQGPQVLAKECRQPSAGAARVAVIGSGPAGLTCAADLACFGYEVTVFERLGAPGGVLAFGIPEFRLSAKSVEAATDGVRRAGVRFQFETCLDDVEAIRGLLAGNGIRAAFAGSAAELPQPPYIPGIDLKGVCSAKAFLMSVNLARRREPASNPDAGVPCRRVIVAGGGNAAIDCARTALRLGAAEITVLYRRSLQQLTARPSDVEQARQEGIQFLPFAIPVRLLGNASGGLRRVECVETDLLETDASGRPSPVARPGSQFQLAADTFVLALGNGPNPEWANTVRGLESEEPVAGIAGSDVRRSVIPGVFAGGEMIAGGTVSAAMRCGRAAARAIHRYLTAQTAIS